MPVGFAARGPLEIPAAAGYSANAVFFANDTYFTSTGLSPAFADGATGFVSFWVNFATSGNEEFFLCSGGGGNVFSLQREFSTGKFQINGANSTPTTIMTRFSSAAMGVSAWTHVMASWDLSVPVCQIWIDGVNGLGGGGAVSLGNIDYDSTAYWHWFNNNGGGLNNINAGVADFFFDFSYHDLSVQATVDKFIDPVTFKPVDLGAAGATPFGSSPLVFLSGATASWHTNKGSGGTGFTVNGTALATAGSSPSD